MEDDFDKELLEDESIVERISGLGEMFPERLRSGVAAIVSKTSSSIRWTFSATRTVAWIACSTAAILVLPISLESERLAYEQQVKRQERNIILGPEGSM